MDINAETARKIAKETTDRRLLVGLATIENEIKAAAQQGKTEYVYLGHISEELRRVLHNNGFTVGKQESFRNETQVTISWEKEL